MSRKTSPARRAAFLAAVAATGNQMLAAERAKVSRSWVHLHQSTDPAFRVELDAAIATARASLKARRVSGGGARPGTGWDAAAGEELVVRGGNGRRTQIARARLVQWTPRIEARFLRLLAETCNVRAACVQVELSPASAYNHRKRWPAFAARWDEAIEEGYDRIKGMLLENAFHSLGAEDVEPEICWAPMSFDDAMQVLRLHHDQVHGIGRARRRRG